MTRLENRDPRAELMDDAGIEFEEFAQTLKQLENLNRLTQAYRPTLKAIDYFWKTQHRDPSLPLKILDIGSGYGDFLREISHWATEKKIPVELTGVDLSPWSEKSARQATPASMNIRYLTEDIFSHHPDSPYHIIINSLFTHHLKDEEVLRVIRWMTQQSQYGWFINDLHRHWIPYYFIAAFVRIGRYNRLIQNDAPLSVARAFRREDWESLVKKAGLPQDKIRIQWHWPFRYTVRYSA